MLVAHVHQIHPCVRLFCNGRNILMEENKNLLKETNLLKYDEMEN
jgi:hypothetical protein